MRTASKVTIGERREALPRWFKLAGPGRSAAVHGPESDHGRPGPHEQKKGAHITTERRQPGNPGRCGSMGAVRLEPAGVCVSMTEPADDILSLRKVSADADAHIEQERMRSQTVKDDGQCRDPAGI